MWGWMGSGSRITEGGSSIMVMAALPCCLTLQALLPSERRAHMHTRMHTHMRCCSNTPQPSRFAAAAAAAACLLLLLLFQAPPPRTAATAFLSGPSAAPPRRCLIISSSPTLPHAPFFCRGAPSFLFAGCLKYRVVNLKSKQNTIACVSCCCCFYVLIHISCSTI